MKKTYSITATPVQFFELAEQIQNELSNIGRDVITIHKPAFLILFAVGSEGSWRPDRKSELANYRGDTEIFIRAESKALGDKGITVIVKEWDGEISKLAIEYRDKDDWELAKDTWTIFEAQIKQHGWELKSTMPRQWVMKRLGDFVYAPAITHDARPLLDDVRADSRQEQVEAMKLLQGIGTQGKTLTDKIASNEMGVNRNMTTDSIEITVSGTPHEFASFAIDFGETQRASNPDAPRYYISNTPQRTIPNQRQVGTRSIPQSEIDYDALQRSNRLIIQCVQGGGLIDGKYEAENHLGEIVALKIPNERTRLRVVADAENATAFLQEWELLREEMIRWEFANRSGQDMAENTQTHARIELDVNGKGTDVGAAVEHLLSLQNSYGCSVRWLNRREDREPHKTQTIELEYAVSGFDENYGQSYRRMLSRAHIVIYPKPQGAHITFTYPDQHAQIYFPFWDDLCKLMGEWSILANTAPAPNGETRDETIYQGRVELDRNRLFDLVRDFVRDANRVWSNVDDWRNLRAAWNTQESSILILATRNRTLGEYPIVELLTTTAGQHSLQLEIISDAKGNREIATALRKYLLDATAPAPKEQNADTPKTPSIEPSQWQKGKAGRKSDKGYDAAFDMIENGTPQNEARDWYFRENNLSLTDQQAIKNFNDALRRRKVRVIAK